MNLIYKINHQINMATFVNTHMSSLNTSPKKRSLDTVPTAPKKARVAAPKINPGRYNWRTNKPTIKVYKDKDQNQQVQFQSPNGQPYKVMAPPGVTKFVELREGGNIGKFNWCATEKTATMGFIYTGQQLPMKENETAEAHAERTAPYAQKQREFVDFLKETARQGFTELFNSVEPLREQFLKKAKSVLSDDAGAEKLNEMALKLMVKAGMNKSPIKEDGAGGFEFNVKCSAFFAQRDSFTPRRVHVYDSKYQEHPTVTRSDIKPGAVISPIFTVRLYTTPGYKTFGVTYQLEHQYIILNKNGTEMGGRTTGRLPDDKLKQRAYQMKGATSKSGRYNVYVNDLSGNKYLHRAPAMTTKYCDLENGTLDKFPGTTEDTAKLTATFVEDESNKEYFDHIEQLVRDVGTYLLNDDNVMKENKAELRQTAQDIAEETAGDVETTMKNLFMGQIQSPLKEVGDERQLKISQRMFKAIKADVDAPRERNTFAYEDEDADPISDPFLEPGCTLAPVLDPQVYILANGTAGVKLVADLAHPIRMANVPNFCSAGNDIPAYSDDDF